MRISSYTLADFVIPFVSCLSKKHGISRFIFVIYFNTDNQHMILWYNYLFGYTILTIML